MLRKTILLIDDHSLFRSGLRILLSNCVPDVEIVEAAGLEEAMVSAHENFDLILLDIKLRGLNGLEGSALLKRKWPDTSIIVISADDSPETIRLALSRGAAHFISKGSSPDEILHIISHVLNEGGSNAIATDAAANLHSEKHKPLFTPRQYEVLDLLCKGLSNKMIGRQLVLSENTVRCHVQVLLAELNASNRAEAAFTARRMGLVA